MGLSTVMLSVPEAVWDAGMEDRAREVGPVRYGWDGFLRSVFVMGTPETAQRRSRQRFGSVVSAVAVILLVESLVGHAATILVFVLLVAIGLCGRVGRPLLLVGATVVLAAEILLLASIPASPAPGSMPWGGWRSGAWRAC